MITFKQVFWTLAVTATVALGACGDDGSGDDSTSPDAMVEIDAPPGVEVRVPESIEADTTWTKDHVYILPRLRQVFVYAPATLTIEPGTRIEGEQGAVLVITRGAKIMAVGTAAEPIVMTSRQANTPGYWGGLLVLGAAPINVNVNATPASNEATFEAFSSAIPEGKYGGDNPADNSGKLKYVRIEFGGFEFITDREFNNLSLAGVGSGTEIDYVQVHQGNDDGCEVFGGRVNLKHLVISQNGDDGLDTDNGWQGNAQFVIVQDVAPQGTREDSNGYESDNHGTSASYEADPRTLPTVSNVTLIGKHDYTVPARSHFAGVLRRGTGGKYYNHIVMDFADGIEFRDDKTKIQLDAGNLFFQNALFYNNGADGTSLPAPQTGTGIVDIVESNYLDAAHNCQFTTDPMLPAARNSLTAPDFKPTAVTECGATPTDPFFDATATFCGAVGATDWTLGWTDYPQPQ